MTSWIFSIRFANIFHTTNITVDKMWSVAIKIKSQKSLDFAGCSGSGLYDDLSYLVDKVEQQLEVNSSAVIHKNISAEHLNAAGDIFVYLNACPTPNFYWFRPYKMFYKNLFESKSPKEIILTINRFMKTLAAIDEDITIEEKLFKRATKLFNLQYKEIQSMLDVVDARNVSLKSDIQNQISSETESKKPVTTFYLISYLII